MLEVRIPDEIFSNLNIASEQQEKFVLEAVKEKIARESNKIPETLLIEGYEATRDENSAAKQKSRPFNLAAGEFSVPDDFNRPLDESQTKTKQLDANGYPHGFFEETFGSIPNLPEREA